MTNAVPSKASDAGTSEGKVASRNGVVRSARVLALQARISSQAEVQYRANFVAWIFNSGILVATTLATFGIVFGHVDRLHGWTSSELVAVLGAYFLLSAWINGVVHASMSTLVEEVMDGSFDYWLLKPFDAQLLGITRHISIWSLLDAPLGLALLVYGILHAPSTPHGVAAVGAIAVALALLVVSMLLVVAFWTLITSLVFWSIQGQGILWALDDLYENVRWPISIFGPGLRTALTVVFPLGVAITAPPAALLDRFDLALVVELVAVTAVLLALSRWAWRRAIAHYASASS